MAVCAFDLDVLAWLLWWVVFEGFFVAVEAVHVFDSVGSVLVGPFVFGCFYFSYEVEDGLG